MRDVDPNAVRFQADVGDGAGVGEYVKSGVGGYECGGAVHVRVHIGHVADRHLWRKIASAWKV